MENPVYHQAWNDAIEKAKADPERSVQVLAVIADVERKDKSDADARAKRGSPPLCGSSLLSKTYHALLDKGLVDKV